MTIGEPLSSSQHPSFLALDRAALGAPSSEVTKHLTGCDECRRYVQELSQPPRAAELSRIRADVARNDRRAVRVRWLAAASTLAAAACLLLFAARIRPHDSEQPASYVGAKGFSSVWIYVKRGSTTQLWDGKQSIAGGDRLRIKVDPAGYRHVEVYSAKAAEAPELLYSGSVTPTQSITLPDAWEIDQEPGAERLFVVFSSGPVKPTWSKWLRGEVEPGVTVQPFVLPKVGSASPDASGAP